MSRLRLKCDGTCAETRFRLPPKGTSPFKSAWASVQSTTGSRGVRISGSNAGYTVFRGSVKSTGCPLHSSVSPSLPLPCVTVCHYVSNALYSLFYCFIIYRPARNWRVLYCKIPSEYPKMCQNGEFSMCSFVKIHIIHHFLTWGFTRRVQPEASYSNLEVETVSHWAATF
jgi:hypothetical protein